MPRIRSTAREDCDTKDFLSLPKKVLVTLICFICSFFSTARRTNQEAPPQLSGFWVRRRSRRRGLRNSLRSDSPRPFSSVFLATSPPDKGGDFAHAFAGLFNPSVLADTSPIFCATKHPVRLRDTAGEEGESDPPLIAERYSAYGARQGRSLEVALYSFAIFLFQPPRPAGTPPIFPYGNTGGEEG